MGMLQSLAFNKQWYPHFVLCMQLQGPDTLSMYASDTLTAARLLFCCQNDAVEWTFIHPNSC